VNTGTAFTELLAVKTPPTPRLLGHPGGRQLHLPDQLQDRVLAL